MNNTHVSSANHLLTMELEKDGGPHRIGSVEFAIDRVHHHVIKKLCGERERAVKLDFLYYLLLFFHILHTHYFTHYMSHQQNTRDF